VVVNQHRREEDTSRGGEEGVGCVERRELELRMMAGWVERERLVGIGLEEYGFYCFYGELERTGLTGGFEGNEIR
jgi:hypothetical protein